MPQPRTNNRVTIVRRQRAVGAVVLVALFAVLLVVIAVSSRSPHARSLVAVGGARSSTTVQPTAVPRVKTIAPSSTVASVPNTASAPAASTTITPVATAGAGLLGAVAGKIIAIDPGHNGENWKYTSLINEPVNIGTESRACDTTGTETADGYTESAYNLDVSLRLAAILRTAGATVVLTRTNDDGWGPCITQRAAIGNNAHANVAISIHADGGPADGHGFHVLYPESLPGLTTAIAPASLRLAYDIRNAYRAGTGMPFATYIGNGDGLMQRSDLGGLNLSTVPKVFIETGNMRNVSDAALLESASFRQEAAAAIADGLAAYLAGR